MKAPVLTFCLFWLLPALVSAQQYYLGFDKNTYPGDSLFPALHKTFAFTGYWLNNPPGMNTNPWTGKRPAILAAGFGFLVLYDGRLDTELKLKDPTALGQNDASDATARAAHEGFSPHTIIFLDQEEGGRLLSEQATYIRAWIQQLAKSGYRPGIYCSGIGVGEGQNRISTAQDIAAKFPDVKLWVANDECPPSSGCIIKPSDPSQSGILSTLVWQYAQSPRRSFAKACKSTYANDGNCYALGIKASNNTFLDLDASKSADPSMGR